MMAQLNALPVDDKDKVDQGASGEGDVKEQFLQGLKKAGLDVAA